jgi:hypothetical protein
MSCLVAEKMWEIKGLRKSSFWIFQFCEGLSDFYVLLLYTVVGENKEEGSVCFFGED